MINYENIQPLYEKYLALMLFEIDEFGAKPTELRHLMGRLGEFYCVKETRGSLPERVNQPGFDVLAYDNKKISVKTTAQLSGFVAISKKTLDLADELMLVHYADGQFLTIYHGCIRHATMGIRQYGNNYELDISKARKITAAGL